MFKLLAISLLVQTSLLFCGLAMALESNQDSKTGSAKQKIYLALNDCFDKALKQSEQLKLTIQNVKVAEARYREALAAVYPNIHLLLTDRYRGQTSSSSSNDSTGSGSDGNSNNRSNSSSSRNKVEGSITLIQPIFSGFREQFLIDSAKTQIDALKLESERAKDLLFLDLAELFYQIMTYQKDLQLLNKSGQINRERISDLTHFMKLGKARESERFSAQAELDQVIATQRQTEGALEASKELLAFLIGIPSTEIWVKEESIAEAVQPVEFYISRSSKRPDIAAAKERLKAQEFEIRAAERAHWPSVSAEINYFPLEEPDREKDWNSLLKLDLPIFEGGALDARIAIQRAELRSRKIESEQLVRSSERDIREQYQRLLAARSESVALANLVGTTSQSYRSQRSDYSLGLVTNLEVLQSQRQMQDAGRNLLQAELSERLARVRLDVAAGGVGK